MHYRRLGKCGLKISELSLGTWITFGNQIEDDVACKLVKTAYDHGINYFDTSDMYADGKAEVILGKAIKSLPREELVISSKVFFPTTKGPNGRGLSRKHIMESINTTLKRLGTDYLDIYICQRYDPDTTIEELVHTMNLLIQQGKIYYWGTSEWTPLQISRANDFALRQGLITPTLDQPQYNMFNRERVELELVPITRELGYGLTTTSPLFYGVLTGKYNEGIPPKSRAAMVDMEWLRTQITPEKLDIVRKLTTLAESLEMTTAQLVIAWTLRRKEISSIIMGATHPEQLDENLAGLDYIETLDEEVLDQIELILDNTPF